LIRTAAKTSYTAALSNILQNWQMSLELAKSLYLNLKLIVGEEKEKIQAILKIKNYLKHKFCFVPLPLYVSRTGLHPLVLKGDSKPLKSIIDSSLASKVFPILCSNFKIR
jgi:hypothetical protein